jgi:hypothetical protein
MGLIMTMVGGLWFTGCEFIASFTGKTDDESKKGSEETISPGSPPFADNPSFPVFPAS